MAYRRILINRKTISWITRSVSLLVVVVCLLSWIMVMGGFTKLENKFALQNIERAQEVITDGVTNLSIKLADWATWDDTYAFVEDKNEAYIKSNLTDSALSTLDINMMGFFNARGELVWFMDNEQDEGSKLLIPEGLKQYLVKHSVLLDRTKADDFLSGVVLLPEGPFFIATKPILKSDDTGPIRGTMMFGKHINADELKRWGGIIQAVVSLQRMEGGSLPPDFKVAQATFAKGEKAVIEKIGSKTIAGYGMVKDIFGQPVMILKTATPRDITSFGHNVLGIFILALLIVGFIFGIAVYIPLEKEISGREQAEKKLIRSHEAFFQLAENGGTVNWEVDAQGRYIDVSLVSVLVFGYRPDELIGRMHFYDFHPEEGRDAFKQAILARFGRKESFRDVVNAVQRKDGRQVWVATNGMPILNADGTLQGYRGSDTDITERKRAESVIRESEERFRGLSETSLTGIYIIQDDIVKYANPIMTKLLGYSLDELVGSSPLKAVHPDDHAVVTDNMRRRLSGEASSLAYEIRLIRKDGRTLDFLLMGVRIDYEGRPAVAGTLLDITENKKAEEGLRASQQLIEGIINAIPVRVFWKDKELVYLGCNAIFARDAGFDDPKDVIGKDDFQMTWHDQADLYGSDDRQVIESGNPKLFIEEPQTTPAGDSITLLTSKMPLRNSHGEICGVLGTYIDITNRKKLEEEAKKRLKELEIFYKASFAREERILELKKEVEQLKKELGR
jgi:PAS domain S-box-containing protein